MYTHARSYNNAARYADALTLKYYSTKYITYWLVLINYDYAYAPDNHKCML